MANGDDGLGPDLLREFLVECRAELEQARESCARLTARDAEPEAAATLKRAAHRLAGSAGTYGFPEVTERARALEAALVPLIDAGARIDRSDAERFNAAFREIESLLFKAD